MQVNNPSKKGGTHSLLEPMGYPLRYLMIEIRLNDRRREEEVLAWLSKFVVLKSASNTGSPETVAIGNLVNLSILNLKLKAHFNRLYEHIFNPHACCTMFLSCPIEPLENLPTATGQAVHPP